MVIEILFTRLFHLNLKGIEGKEGATGCSTLLLPRCLEILKFKIVEKGMLRIIRPGGKPLKGTLKGYQATKRPSGLLFNVSPRKNVTTCRRNTARGAV